MVGAGSGDVLCGSSVCYVVGKEKLKIDPLNDFGKPWWYVRGEELYRELLIS